ncbi:MAG: metallophosphoesterase [Planctomycetota bacterium]
MGTPHFQTETLEHGPNFVLGRTTGFTRKRLTVTGVDVPEPLRILHITDIHALPRWQPAYDKLLARIADNTPDLILMTGDYVDDRFDHREAVPILRKLLAGFTAKHGVFAIVGNHDTDLLIPKLGDMGVTVLCNQLAFAGGLEIVGLAGVRRGEVSRAWLGTLPEPERPRVLLTHYPDALRTHGPLGASLVLAGHTHGGQVCLPGGKPLITHDTLGPGFHRGAHRYENAVLLVGTGLGCSTHHVRTWCPPEVWEVVLTPSQSDESP